MRDFWLPTHKFQLVEWFVGRNILERNKANRMSKKQLYGKYCEIRSKE